MRHFTTEEWIDFVNQVTPDKQQEAMRKHLESGCKGCAEKMALWQKVRGNAAFEANYQPPADSVRVVKAAYAAAGMGKQPKKSGAVIELLFDSLLQPAVSGARSAGKGTRQMLYRADSYQVDLLIETKPGGKRLMVTGQLMDVSTPEIVGRDVQVTLSNCKGSAIRTATNEFGEFRCEIDNSGDLELSVPGRRETPITISLRNALGELPGGKV
jgi:hypothetical protein